MSINKIYLSSLLEQYYEEATPQEEAIFEALVNKIGKVVESSDLTSIGNDALYAVAEVIAEKLGEADLVFPEKITE